MKPRNDLDVVFLLLRGQDAVSYEEIQQQQSAIRLELSVRESFLHFGQCPKSKILNLIIARFWNHVGPYFHVVDILNFWLQQACLSISPLIPEAEVRDGSTRFGVGPNEVLCERSLLGSFSYHTLERLFSGREPASDCVVHHSSICLSFRSSGHPNFHPFLGVDVRGHVYSICHNAEKGTSRSLHCDQHVRSMYCVEFVSPLFQHFERPLLPRHLQKVVDNHSLFFGSTISSILGRGIDPFLVVVYGPTAIPWHLLDYPWQHIANDLRRAAYRETIVGGNQLIVDFGILIVVWKAKLVSKKLLVRTDQEAYLSQSLTRSKFDFIIDCGLRNAGLAGI